MSKRVIESEIWKDNKFRRELNVNEKLLWFYLLTNEYATSVGIYCLPFETIAFELKFDEDEIKRYMMKLTDLDMMTYDITNEEVVIYNAPLYNICSWGKPMVDKVNSELSKVKNVGSIKLVLEHLKKHQIDRPNDKKSCLMENIIPLYENALKPVKEKEKGKGKDKSNNIDINNNINNNIYINNESCHESLENEKSFDDLVGELDNEQEENL